MTELIKNARAGNLERVRDLLREGVNINAKDKNGYTPLITASCYGHLDVVRELFMHNTVDVNAAGNDGNSPFIWACIRGQLIVVRELLNHGEIDAMLEANLATLLSSVPAFEAKKSWCPWAVSKGRNVGGKHTELRTKCSIGADLFELSISSMCRWR
jgi:ankyrin repeat protein